jgi:cell wall-associated NlpC family hydrolase
MSGAIASTALRYQGVPYKFGGGNPGGWDCSGMVNWVLGHDLGLVLPGGGTGFSGSTHGPVVLAYATWGGASTVKGPPAPGDLCVWPGAGPLGHIGIAVGPRKMVSALNPSQGTAVTPIHGYGPPGVPVVYRRVNAAAGGAGTTAAGVDLTGCVPAMIFLPLIAIRAALVHLRRGSDHHRGAQVIGDDQDVVSGKLVNDLP